MTNASEDVEDMNHDHRGDDAVISPGWSITVGELKKALATVPDDYEVMLCNAEVDDIDISNVNIDGLLPPALGSPGILRLSGGQILNSEYAYHPRLDVSHQVGTTHWHRDRGAWVTM